MGKTDYTGMTYISNNTGRTYLVGGQLKSGDYMVHHRLIGDTTVSGSTLAKIANQEIAHLIMVEKPLAQRGEIEF